MSVIGFLCLVAVLVLSIVFIIRWILKKPKKGVGIAALCCLGACIVFMAAGSEAQEGRVINNADAMATNKSIQAQSITPAQTPEESAESYKESCEEIGWKDLARNPSQYIGKRIMVTGKVSQILSGSWSSDGGCRVYEDYNFSTDDTWNQKEWFISMDPESISPRILNNDVVTFYGEFIGTTEIVRALTGTKEEVITLQMAYYTIHDETDDATVTLTQSSEATKSVDSNMTMEQRNALGTAKSYLSFSAFSYEGLIEQLEYEQFSNKDAVYAADNCGADWNEQALKSAKSYLSFSAFSYKGLIKQLQYEKFTSEQAKYGVDNCGADWNEQAAKSAESYLSYSSFSRKSLIKQLKYEGFTQEQAVYGVEANGY